MACEAGGRDWPSGRDRRRTIDGQAHLGRHANLHICDILSHVRSVTYTLPFARGRRTKATQAADIARAREHLQQHRGNAKR